MTKYFECKPTLLCKGADCCTTPETKPALSVGDYLRLSWFTQEPVVDIWRNKGDVFIYRNQDFERGHFSVTLCLLHDPCPYLSKQYRCTIHEHRPLGCGSFPILLFKNHPEQIEQFYKEYQCLQGVKPKHEQIQLSRNLESIMEQEAILAVKFFFKGEPPYIDVSTSRAFYDLAIPASHLQMARDPGGTSRWSEKLVQALEKMNSLVEQKVELHFSKKEFAELLSPVMFALLVDDFAQRFEELPEEAIEAYKKTTEQWLKLAGKIE